MNAHTSVSASLVLFMNPTKDVEVVLRGLTTSSVPVQVQVVDNSPTDALRTLCEKYGVGYHYEGQNLGFGSGHNRAVELLAERVGEAHLIINPDVTFGAEVIGVLADLLQKHPDVGMVVPRATYPDGSPQNLCKRLPSPWIWAARRFLKLPFLLKRINHRFEMHDLDQSKPIKAPYLSGCFMMVRSRLFLELGGFDQRFFLYSEDADLARRVFEKSTCVYYPHLTIKHKFGKGSHRSRRLLWIAIVSTVRYFNKWGWIFDQQRGELNKRVGYWEIP